MIKYTIFVLSYKINAFFFKSALIFLLYALIIIMNDNIKGAVL